MNKVKILSIKWIVYWSAAPFRSFLFTFTSILKTSKKKKKNLQNSSSSYIFHSCGLNPVMLRRLFRIKFWVSLTWLFSPRVLPQSLKMVLREALAVQPQASGSPLPQLVSMYHHLESVINTACYNLWTGLL